MADISQELPDAEEPAVRNDLGQTAEFFSRLAMEMHEADGIEETVQAVVEYAIQALNCEYAGVALRTSGGRLEIPAVTDPVVAEIYRFQTAGGDGPLVLCMQERATVVVPDVVLDARWLDWAKKVLELGVRSVLDVPLWTSAGPVGVLGLYSRRPDAFGPDDIAVAYILARHAAVAVASARREEHLKVAIDARKLIGQAMGILMERYKLTGDQAFQVLRRYSQDTNTKLRDVAQQLIDSRRLPSG
ncbi:GAF and ANTAR domain-containing protein [Kribbella sp.]|uniref:GAF and ANTAR domain-containing protein n=1 Tax=Kribbella sp. TaxID=1871183 RepID=UPI002D294963|nr:GAF and ANTAR domain-containing protein [Kribbella sp.]HZX07601.1 GAF and ANTAR domain-containing protein [Kribbella sp.]